MFRNELLLNFYKKQIWVKPIPHVLLVMIQYLFRLRLHCVSSLTIINY